MTNACSLTVQKGELCFKAGHLEVYAPAPCMNDFNMELLLQALETRTVYKTATTAQVTAFISARHNQARYAWSFGDHTPCGSAICCPLPLLLTTLYDLMQQHHSQGWSLAMPQWLQLGIEPQMKCFEPTRRSSPSPSPSELLSSSASSSEGRY